MEPEMLSFLSRNKTQHDKHSRMENQLTLNAFFDEHYFPQAKVAKRQPHHDWCIYNKHIRASMGSYFWMMSPTQSLIFGCENRFWLGYQRSTINKHIHLTETTC